MEASTNFQGGEIPSVVNSDAPMPNNNGNEEEEEKEEEDKDDDEDTFHSLFESFSKQWLGAQLTHHVSLTASQAFWNLAFKYGSNLNDLKTKENIKKKIPQFLQVRKNMYAEICPKVHMSFAFLNKADGSIIRVEAEKTPLNEYQRNPQYQKLFEEAHIEVIIVNSAFRLVAIINNKS